MNTVVKCSLCDRPMRSEAAVQAHCEECGAPICFYCAMIEHATHCAVHAPVQPEVPQPRLACATCGKWPVDAYNSAECRALGCHERICNECLGTGSMYCPTHATVDENVPVLAATRVTQIRCGFCGRVLEPGAATRVCSTDGCSSPLCRQCVRDGHDRCGAHLREFRARRAQRQAPRIRRAATVPTQATPQPPVDRPTTQQRSEQRPPDSRQPEQQECAKRPTPPPAVPDGADTVTAPAARIAATNFISRFRRAMQEPRTMTTGVHGERVSTPGWARPAQCDNGHRELEALARSLGPGALQPGACPGNARLVYEVAPRRWLGLGRAQRQLLIEARTVVRPERYLALGCDWEPLGIEDVIGILESSSTAADRDDYFHVLCLFSPTGWSEDMRRMVSEGPVASRLVLPGVKLALVGPDAESVFTNQDDPRAGELDDLFPLVLAGERIALLAQRITETIGYGTGIGLDDAVSATGAQRNEVLAAFKLLEADGQYELISIRGKEPMISRRSL